MGKPRYPHCYCFKSRAAGTDRWYVRIANGPKTRVHGKFGSKEFEANYYSIMNGLSGAPPVPTAKTVGRRGTLKWLISEWKQSSNWLQTSKATQKQRENILLRVLKEAGQFPYEAITEAHIRDGRERRRKTPAAANNFLKTMRALFRWALDEGLITHDPAVGVKLFKTKTEGFAPWNMGDVAKFKERWPLGTRERLALELLINTGLRRSDVVRLGPQHIEDGIAVIEAEKTGVTLYIPIAPTLEEAIASTQTGSTSFLISQYGRPMVKEAFGNWFRRACDEAGLKKSAHGIRKLAATVLANTSGSEHELQALFGWQTNTQSSVYTREANKKQLALQAAMKLQAGLEHK